MYWQQRFDRVDPDLQIRIAIEDIRKDHPNYGYRRLLLLLRSRGIVINKKRLQRIMQKFNLQVIAFSRKSRKYNSYKGVKGRIAPNRIKRRFYCSQPHQKITTDTTEFKYYELDANGALKVGKLYLDPFMDLYNLEIISFSISPTPSAESILSAQQQAIEKTADAKYRRTFHSDRGWGYQMKAYQHNLKVHNIFQSMSRRGNCLDNSPMENFFAILKQEMYYDNTFHSYDELKMAIENYMPDFAVEAVYDLTVQSLKNQGIKAVLVDLDNTLIAWNNPDGTPEMKQWLHDLRDAGIRIIVVSNNSKKRVQRAVEKFGIDYVYWALKPFTFGIDRAMKEFHYEKNEVVMVGDQLMTDIRAAHRAGIRSILVKPLVQHDSIKTKFNRARERRVMKQITEKYGPITYKKGI